MLQVHLSAKPANFCLRQRHHHHFEEGQTSPKAPSFCIIDLGGCSARSTLMDTGKPASFCGTAEYAGSTALQMLRPGPADDLESLAYR